MYVQSVTKIECKSAATENYEKLSNKNLRTFFYFKQ